MKIAAIITLGLVLAFLLPSCLSTRAVRNTIPTPAGPMGKEEVAGEIRAGLDAAEAAPADARLRILREDASRILSRIGEESDAGHLLARGMEEADAAGSASPLAARMEEALDALSLTLVVEAEIPEDWPEPSQPGLVRVKSYPGVRLARVSADETSNSLFRELFRHIDQSDIPMTSPVEMNVPGEPGAAFMSFLYASEETGPIGREGAVEVLDAEEITVASVAVRGAYTDANFQEGLEAVRAWLADPACKWREAGAPRVLAYNSPFVPWFLKFSEVQIQVATK